MTRVLVTGGSGFIGRHVLRECLGAGHELHAVARRSPPLAQACQLQWHELDLLDGEATERLLARLRPELLIHLAWYAEHGRFWNAPENLDWVQASLGLARAFARAGGRRIVTAGTCAEYDWAALGQAPAAGEQLVRCREHVTPLLPGTLYGAAKLGVNLVIERYAATVGLEYACGRVFFLYGPDEQQGRLVPAIALGLLRGEPVQTSDGGQIRDFLHVDDVAGAFARIAAGELTGPVNIGSGEPVAVGRVLDLLGELTGRPELIERGARKRAPQDPPVLLADVGRLRGELGFVPRIGLVEGLAGVVDRWRERLGAGA